MTISSSERPAAPHDPDRATENAYRDRLKWDDVVQSSHAEDCYPTVGACPYQVYLKDGEIRFQEQAAKFPIVEEGVPDFYPMGCQKGLVGIRCERAPAYFVGG